MRYAPAALVAPPAFAVAVMAWAALVVVGVPPLVAIAPAAAAGLLVGALLHSRAPRAALRSLRARPLARGDHPRLENLIDGVCTTYGFHEPTVHVVETPAINAASVGLRRPAAHLVVTRGALTDLGSLSPVVDRSTTTAINELIEIVGVNPPKEWESPADLPLDWRRHGEARHAKRRLDRRSEPGQRRQRPR